MQFAELMALLFGVAAILGTLSNYNLVYAALHRGKVPWWLARRLNRGFPALHFKLRWSIYPLSLLWYTVWAIWFTSMGLWVTSCLIGVYFLTRVPTWFVLSKRSEFLRKRDKLASYGPVGTLEPINDQ